ncbi:hypothetical protein P7K49_008834 [Saguinus oedipus]|uniref:Uncharacterized protein n=1 Tax=Saguinus oedipus TaxID=9490 RepID=A0ABQ9VYW4_SAGOE|nr:hypothetical protein P7K49_008834 [Saguinus oedipus]
MTNNKDTSCTKAAQCHLRVNYRGENTQSHYEEAKSIKGLTNPENTDTQLAHEKPKERKQQSRRSFVLAGVLRYTDESEQENKLSTKEMSKR